MRKNQSDIIQDLIQRVGGSYSRNLGFDLKSLRPGEVFKWLLAARDLGLLSPNLSSQKKILDGLKALWKNHGVAGMDITDFEAALVRQGIENRRRKR
jgi:hypothetical protein